MGIENIDDWTEVDISAEFEKSQCEYERKNAKNIKISVIPESVLTPEQQEKAKKNMDEWTRQGKESMKQFEKDIADGKTNFGKIMVSDSLKQLLKGE